ncbi:MAG TPA: hypothetical protein VJ499_06735 [Flavisolibacter sp.]|nr:hypothetical protein [Flavisolibacter sp.]
MKYLLICTAFVLLGMNKSIAQQKKSSTSSNSSATAPVKYRRLNLEETKESKRYSLSNTASHKAYADPKAAPEITDPVINLLNAKASGSPYTIDKSTLVGVPSGTYGFANGKISLYQQGATSTGTNTGSGAVGTGSSSGGIGTVSPFIGVNGKSPYTGSGPYGTRLRQQNAVNDSTKHQ